MSQVSNPKPCFFLEKNELSPFSHKLGKNESDKPEKFFLADIYLTWAKYEQIQSETFDQIWETCQLNDLWKLSELFSEFYAAICQFSWVLFRIFAVIHFWVSVLEMATSFFLLLCHYHIQNVLVISTIYYNFFHWFNFFFYQTTCIIFKIHQSCLLFYIFGNLVWQVLCINHLTEARFCESSYQKNESLV